MKSLKIILIFLLLGVSISGFSQSPDRNSVADSDKQSVELTINNEKVLVTTTTLNTKVEIFSIIGSKVLSANIKSGLCESVITLPKGYYILKIDGATRKIAVK
ncbi:T9SS type A sorting domain-containing protein [Viscerimonas tarda]